MRESTWLRRACGTCIMLIVAVGFTGCAHVKPQEMDARLLELRDEIAQGDRNLAGQITGLEGRISGVESRLTTVQRELSRLETEYNTTVERLGETLRFNIPDYLGFDEEELLPDHR